MPGSIFDLISIGYKRAVYATLMVTCITPGILYLYLENRPFFESLSTSKTILFSIAVASPVAVFNMGIAFAVIYLLFTREQYQKGKRLSEEVINRAILLSTMMSTSLSLNFGVIGLYFVKFQVSCWLKILAFARGYRSCYCFFTSVEEKSRLGLFPPQLFWMRSYVGHNGILTSRWKWTAEQLRCSQPLTSTVRHYRRSKAHG